MTFDFFLARLAPSILLLAACGARTPLDELSAQSAKSAGGAAGSESGFVGPIGAGGGGATGGGASGHAHGAAPGTGGTLAGGHAAGGNAQGGVAAGGTSGDAGGSAGQGAGGAGAVCTTSGGPGVGVDAWIAFEADPAGTGRNLFAIRADGCDLTQLTDGHFVDTQPAWSPDGGRIAFVSTRSGAPSLHLLDVASRSVAPLGVACTMPSWSPDSTVLVCATDTALRAFLVADPSQGQSLSPQSPQPPEWPSFSPDGSAIVYDIQNAVERLDIGTQTSTPLIPSTTDSFLMPAVSPGQDTLAIVTFCDQGIENIWGVPYGGFKGFPCNDGFRITPAGQVAKRPAWGPGNLMAYQRGAGSTTLSLLVVGAKASPYDLTTTGNVANPSWSPVGIPHP